MNINGSGIEAWILKQLKYLVYSVADYFYIAKHYLFSPRTAFASVMKEKITITPLMFFIYSIVLAILISAFADKRNYKIFETMVNSLDGLSLRPNINETLWGGASYIIGFIIFAGFLQIVIKKYNGDYCTQNELYYLLFYASALFIPIALIKGLYSSIVSYCIPILTDPSPDMTYPRYIAWQIFLDLVIAQIANYLCLFWWGAVIASGLSSLIANKANAYKIVCFSIVAFLVLQIFTAIIIDWPDTYGKLRYKAARYLRNSSSENEQRMQYILRTLFGNLANDENLALDVRYASQLYAIYYYMLRYEQDPLVQQLENRLRLASFEECEIIIKEFIDTKSKEAFPIRDGGPDSGEKTEIKLLIIRNDIKEISRMYKKAVEFKAQPDFIVKTFYEMPFSFMPTTKYFRLIP